MGAFLILLQIWQHVRVASVALATIRVATNQGKLQPRRSRAGILCHVRACRHINTLHTLVNHHSDSQSARCYEFLQAFPLFVIIMSLFTANCCSSTSVSYKGNSYHPGHLPPLKSFDWFARETWYKGKTPKTSLKPVRIETIRIRFVVTPGWTTVV